MKALKILAIETSCDETGIALLEASGGMAAPKFKVIENLVASQVKVHIPFGGVVPSLAKREHLKNLPVLFKKLEDKIMTRSGRLSFDLIAVTAGPGLEPALWTGIEFAKQLGKQYKKPVVGVNHLEGHLYSFLLKKPGIMSALGARKIKNMFPAVALIVSGGHTILLKLDSLAKWRRLGETRDDAAGEAFDKVARLLDLPYPGGPEIEKLAKKGDPAAIPFPRPMIHDKSYDFSFSGLKTAVLYYIRDNPAAKKADVAASFQEAAIDLLVTKTMRAAREASARSILLSGGVAANRALRARLKAAAKKTGCAFLVPDMTYNLDNAAMIGGAGYMATLRKKRYPLKASGEMNI